MTTLRWGSATDVGLVRESNQDSLLVAQPLFAVADGMGGHRGGEVASATALEILAATFGNSTTRDDLVEAVRRANAKVWDKAQLDDDLRGMGTTLTAIAKVFDEETGAESIAIINVGDSRTYLLHDGALSQVTTDHSFVEEMVRAGEISPEEAEVHPKRNVLTRALGVEPVVDSDTIEITPVPGDRLLLCSDGLVREVSDDQIAATLRRLRNPDEAARELVSMAKANGGHDNITIVIVDVETDTSKPDTSKPDIGEQTSEASPPVPKAPKRKPPKAPRIKVRNRSVVRTAGFVIAAVLLLGAIPGSVVWYARSSFFVGLEGQQLVIYRGRPEPVLFFKPTITERTNVSTNDILPSAIPPLQKGFTTSSPGSAHKYIENLNQEAIQAKNAGIPPVTPTTVKPRK